MCFLFLEQSIYIVKKYDLYFSRYTGRDLCREYSAFGEERGRMTKEVKTQWHPAFCSAVKLELIENKADLDYTNEYHLNSKPIQMDLLVIMKFVRSIKESHSRRKC